MRAQRRSATDIAALIGLGATAIAGAKTAYEKARFAMGGTREERITVKRISQHRVPKGALRVGRTSLAKMGIPVSFSGVPVGNPGTDWVVTANDNSQYLITSGHLEFKNHLKVGQTYRIRVCGDPNWGIPKIVHVFTTADSDDDEQDDTYEDAIEIE